jgi:hypothetical protein
MDQTTTFAPKMELDMTEQDILPKKRKAKLITKGKKSSIVDDTSIVSLSKKREEWKENLSQHTVRKQKR